MGTVVTVSVRHETQAVRTAHEHKKRRNKLWERK